MIFLIKNSFCLLFIKAFSEVAKLNPFLVSELPDYFSGGLDDVAKKTTRVWTTLVRMLETGTRCV